MASLPSLLGRPASPGDSRARRSLALPANGAEGRALSRNNALSGTFIGVLTPVSRAKGSLLDQRMSNLCPNGAASSSPGSARPRAYPGSAWPKWAYPNGVMAGQGASLTDLSLAQPRLGRICVLPKVAAARQPWALGRNPVGAGSGQGPNSLEVSEPSPASAARGRALNGCPPLITRSLIDAATHSDPSLCATVFRFPRSSPGSQTYFHRDHRAQRPQLSLFGSSGNSSLRNERLCKSESANRQPRLT